MQRSAHAQVRAGSLRVSFCGVFEQSKIAMVARADLPVDTGSNGHVGAAAQQKVNLRFKRGKGDLASKGTLRLMTLMLAEQVGWGWI